MTRLRILLLVSFIACFVIAQRPGFCATSYDKELAAGIGAYKQGKFQETINHMIDAIAIRGNDAISHYYYAIACRQVGLEDDAATEFRIAHSIDPTGQIGRLCQIALYGKSDADEMQSAMWLYNSHQYADAMKAVKAAIKKVPRDGTAHYYESLLYRAADLNDEADRELDIAYSLDPTVDMGLSHELWMQGHALPSSDQDGFPGLPQGNNPQSTQSQAQSAEPSSRQGSATGPAPEKDELTQGADDYRKKHYEEAIEHLRNSLTTENLDPVGHYYLALCYARLGEKEEANHEFNFVHTIAPTGLAGKYSELAMYGSSNTQELGQGIVSYRSHQYKKAAEHFDKAAGQIPHDPLAHYYLGLSDDYLNERVNAVRQYESAYRLNPQGIIARYCKLAVSGSEPLTVVAKSAKETVHDQDGDDDDTSDDQVKLHHDYGVGSIMNYLSGGTIEDDNPPQELLGTPFKLVLDHKKWKVLPKPFSALEKKLILDHDAINSNLKVHGSLLSH